MSDQAARNLIAKATARVEAAARGSWTLTPNYSRDRHLILSGSGTAEEYEVASCAAVVDATFIAHAHEDVTALAAALDTALAESARLRGIIAEVNAIARGPWPYSKKNAPQETAARVILLWKALTKAVPS